MSAALSLENIELRALRVWSGNPRKTVDPTKLEELAESIREKGVCVPLIVRPLATAEGAVTHEILAGQRRYKAASKVLVEEAPMPCVVRDVDDAEALELGLLENAARDDADPIEEAEAIEGLLRLGRTTQQVADRLGHHFTWVEKRRKLVGLCEEARAWVRTRGVSLAHAQALATVPHDVQGAVARRFAEGELPGSRFFLQELRRHLHALSEAPFDVTDAKLPGGACAKCTKRSDAQMDLFAAAANEGASCLDSACWAGKADAVWDAAQKGAKKRKLAVIATPDEVFSWGESTKHDSAYFTKNRLAEGVELKPVAIARSENGRVVELYDRKAVEEANKRAYASRNGEDEGDDEDGPGEPTPKGPSKWEQERAERKTQVHAQIARVAAVLDGPAKLDALARALLNEDLDEGIRLEEAATDALSIAQNRTSEIPENRCVEVLLLSVLAQVISWGAAEDHEPLIRTLTGEAPLAATEAQPAEGPRRLTLKRSVWQKHRKGLLDAKGLGLHGRWTAVGENRELVLAPGGDLDAVLDYAAEHELALDVRSEGVPALDEADEDAA